MGFHHSSHRLLESFHMDQIREGKRGGTGSSPVSAPRRPRKTGLRGSPALDDDDMTNEVQTSRLRERTKKESSPNVSNARNKRRRQMTEEVHSHLRGTSEDMDENTEEAGGSEDDDDLPLMSRQLGKFIQGKPKVEDSTVHISAVPRKARTAMLKRPQESPSPPVGSVAKQQPPFSASKRLIAIGLKPGRRLKPLGPKPPVSKVHKVSMTTCISEQEVEVAEALFDLARVVPCQASLVVAEGEHESEAVAHSALVSSLAPDSAHTVPADVCSSPSSMLGGQDIAEALAAVSVSVSGYSSSVQVAGVSFAEAPKRKRPRIKTTDDDGDHPVGLQYASSRGITSEISEKKLTTQPVETEKVQAKTHTSPIISVNSLTCSHDTLALVSAPSSSGAQILCSMESKVFPPANNIGIVNAESYITLGEEVPSNLLSVERKTSSGVSREHFSIQKHHEAVGESSGFTDLLTSSENRKQSVNSPSSGTTHRMKFEIDLMDTPRPVEVMGIAKIAVTSSSGTLADDDFKKVIGPAAKSSCKDWKTEIEKDNLQSFQKNNNDNEIGQGRNMDQHNKDTADLDKGQGNIEFKKENVNERKSRKIELLRNLPELAKDSAKEMEKIEDALPSSMPVPVSSLTQQSIHNSLGMTGWPVNLPLGYFSPAAAAAAAAVAAAWPAVPSVNAINENRRKASPFLLQNMQRPWKRCSTHVYIAHYIDLQQQVQRNPLWVATCRSMAADLHGANPYSLNVPLLSANAMFGNHVGAVTAASGSSIVGPDSRGSYLGPGSLIDKSACAAANIHNARARRNSQQQLVQEGEQQELVLSLQGASAISSISSASMGTKTVDGANTAGYSTLVGGSSGIENSLASTGSNGLLVGSVPISRNDTVVNAAAAQVQFLQAMIQQAGFPFSFPPPQFSPAFNGSPGHVTQQATQIFSHPFYGSHLVHPSLHQQLSQATGANASAHAGFGSSQKLHHHMRQMVWDSGPQQQQQFPSPPASSTLYQLQNNSGAHFHHPGNKEGNMGRESNSLLESKIPALQRDAVGATQTGKFQQQQTSRQLQSQQQLPFSSHLQQQQLTVAQHHASSSSSSNFNTAELQAYPNVLLGNTSRSSVGPGPLGLAPVAALMARQGHATLPTMADLSRSHPQSIHQSPSMHAHQHVVIQGQNQHTLLMERANPNTVESCTNIDEVSYTGNKVWDLSEEGKMAIRRSLVPGSSLSRSNSEVSSIAQGLSGAVSQASSNSGVPVHSTVSSVKNIAYHQTGLPLAGLSGSMTSANQHTKPAMGRAKTNIPSSPASKDSLATSFSDRNPGATMMKFPCPGLPFTTQNATNGTQNLRHVAHQASQQTRITQRAGPSPLQTPPGSHAIGTATPKSHGQSPPIGQHCTMSLVQVSGLSPVSGSIPLSPATSLKSTGSVAVKAIPSTRNTSFVQKASGDTPGKKPTSILSSTSGSLSSNPAGHSMHGKVAYPPQQQEVQHVLRLQQQHLSQALQQSRIQQSMLEHQINASLPQHQINASLPPAYQLHKQSLQSQQQLRQLTMQQQLLEQHKQDVTKFQQLSSAQSQTSAHEMEQSHGQHLLHQLSVNSQSLQQPSVINQQGAKLTQLHQVVSSSDQSPSSLGAMTDGVSMTSADLKLASEIPGRILRNEGVTLGSNLVTPINPTRNSVVIGHHRNNDDGANSLHTLVTPVISGQEQGVIAGSTIAGSSPCLLPVSGSSTMGNHGEDKLLNDVVSREHIKGIA